MTEFRYRAYISYSHKDEAWASWLHRGLESYRVPRHLVGSKTPVGEVPARIRPVFRDRDDLSSSTDLADTVKQVLADSECLIVVCSPEAAGSRWVNEEILQFAALDRSGRIFCIIVDGEPAEDGSVSACFPPALAEIGLHEPLAADVRKWADGKRIAKLKLVAGLLGIRLDRLVQRDLQRRRKRQLLVGLAIAVVLALSLMTVFSQISERHEREKAEQLATFVVDLGERLKSDVDLETLALISAEASRHLQTLDPGRLSPETGKKVALALRQVAQVSQYQGRPDEALEAFQRSRDLLLQLNRKHPELTDLLFELGNAEYYVSSLHLDQENHENALLSMEKYHRITQSLLEMEPENPDWMLELSYSNNNLAALQLASGKGINEQTLIHVNEALRLMEDVVALRPEDESVTSVYSTTLAWAADAQYQACNLVENLNLRKQVLELSELSARDDPANNSFKELSAYALTGFARAQFSLGESGPAIENLKSAIEILQQLFAADPGNVHYSEQIFYRQITLVRMLVDTDQLESTGLLLKALDTEFESTRGVLNQQGVRQREYIDFLLVYAEYESRRGMMESANWYLREAVEQHFGRMQSKEEDLFDTQRLVKARYLWWQLNGEGFASQFPETAVFNHGGSSKFRSCTEAENAAFMYVIEGDKTKALREVTYLTDRGYADPGFIRFCQQNDLCGD